MKLLVLSVTESCNDLFHLRCETINGFQGEERKTNRSRYPLCRRRKRTERGCNRLFAGVRWGGQTRWYLLVVSGLSSCRAGATRPSTCSVRHVSRFTVQMMHQCIHCFGKRREQDLLRQVPLVPMRHGRMFGIRVERYKYYPGRSLLGYVS